MEQMKDSSPMMVESTQQQQQSKKKSKNKKKTSRNEMTANVFIDGSSDQQSQVGSVDAVNGLKNQLKQQLQIGKCSNNSDVKVNGLLDEKDLESKACPINTPPANSFAANESTKSLHLDGDPTIHQKPTLNGHHKESHETSSIGTTGKKSKRKPNNKKNPPNELTGKTNQENGHYAEDISQESHLRNGFVEINKELVKECQQPPTKAQNDEIEREKSCNTAMTKSPSDEQNTTKMGDGKGSSKDSVRSADAIEEARSEITSTVLDLSNVHIEYKEYESELQMHDIMRLIQAELSEPYSIYTYRYFIYNWPKLCFLAAHGNEYVGAIVCKLDLHMNVRRGYIAMLAVRKEYRKLKIGTTLVQKAIEAMLADKADEVVLETEMSNLPALRLYENLGFVRDKRLFRYYLNGVDALRLKLWFR
ncbi:N(alpha)-acetyltransferase 30 A [Haematobia irritans]|uniref:N(alpha)-acetyltransferase 30 A n=1 Tax=Haematobia irritans TaxID=7368 RepID=UPI003F503921